MSTILAGKRPTEQRVQDAGSGLLAAAFERHADALLAYIRGHNELPAHTDSYGVEDLAAEVWLEFATNLDRVDERVLDFSYVRLTANKVVRRAAKAETVEVPVGFAGGEQGLAVEGAEFGDDEGYAVAPLEPVAKLGDPLIVGRPRAGMGVGLVRHLFDAGVAA
ncbi:hypothetical protein JK359_33345 [Streptomyces actinomycinicus]|uniref:Uncharacterized protein n=1 Tax=Streptomyces actinomycinicus TaxID=1695166 RepID=A0A937ENW3_9ACTN|nr:hypothetical protein [Streptomyces actinomycinicus]MBL1086793.1 hypothetical protein [Streptomyces actinomycinicus]